MEIGYAFFHPVHEIVQHHAKQLGVKHAVANAGWIGGFSEHVHEWDYMPLLKTKLSMNEFGMEFSVLEGVNFIDDAKLGTDKKDRAIEHFIKLLENASKLGIKTICYNWMP
ncbi:MAG: mannonate dehydratase, partial [Clostridiales bacterium]|nr:mannonate dehydratase [Clostridiales bacterium]